MKREMTVQQHIDEYTRLWSKYKDGNRTAERARKRHFWLAELKYAQSISHPNVMRESLCALEELGARFGQVE